MSRKVKPTKRKVKAKAKRSAVRTTTKRADASARQRELEGRLAEAEAQQAATSEILRIISGSRGDVQPVFDAIVDSAARLCEAEFSAVARLDDDGLLYLAAISNMSPAETEAYHSLFPRPARRDFVIGRAFVDGRPVHIEDVLIDPEYDPRTLAVLQRAATYRTYLGIPLLRNGEPIGAIGCGRRKVKAFTETQIELVKTFAEQAVIAIENVRQFKELEVRNRALTESLDQQTATSEILRVISGSRVDVEPVFDVIVQSAGRLLGGHTALVTRILGDEIHLAAITSTDRSGDNAQRATWPRPVIGPTLHNEVIAQLAPRMSADVSSDPARTPSEAMVARSRGYRSIVVVPLLRDGLALGTLGVTRPTPGSFSDAEIALLQTFADQAVIAIENVRLFTEVEARNRDLTETLEQQTASGEILRVISSSPTDVQPVFDTVVESAARLCESLDTVIFLRDGDRLRLAAHHGQIPVQSTLPLIRETSNGRAILDGRTIHIEDMQHETDEYAVGRENARRMGHRTILCVPMMREGVAIGTIQLRRSEPRLFAPRQVALLETFADQAVIAIENVRLFKELQARNHDLTETLEQQTATGEILRVISASPTDVQPVFDTIAQSAARLCEGERCFVFRFEDGALHFVAYHGVSPEGARAVASTWPAPPTRGSAVGRAVLDGSVAHIPDVQEDLEYELGAVASAADFRSMVAVPMQRDGLPVGAISVLRPQPGRFSTRQIDLLKTFADQAVIAIENVRLFKELEARNRDLTASGEILRVISSSPTEVQPVFETIAASARRLCDASQTAVHTYDGSLVHLSAFDQFDPESAENLRLAFPMTPSGASAAARAILHRALVHIPDVLEYPEYALAAAARTSGFRSVISVPMLRDGSPIGALTVTKETPGAFPDNQIQLLKTFADQAVIAIQNVRLFTELEARNSELRILLEQQTATSEVLKVISRSAFDLDPVLQNVIESATRLCGATRGHIFRLDGDVLRFAAAYGAWPGFTDYLEQNPVRPGPGSVAGRAALERRTIHVVDVRQESGYQYEELLSRQDYRAVLAVPMLREGVLLGVIVILKSTAEPFAPKQIELVTTFADQAVIAIENVRLFSELQASNSDLKVSLEQQTATSELLKVIGRSTFDLEAVFEALAESAVRLCNAERGVIMRFDGQVLRFAVGHNVSAELRGFFEQNPIPLARNTNAGRAAFTRQTVHNHDVLSDPEYGYGGARVDPYRTVLAIPMLRADEVLGVIIIYRHEVRPFTDNQVALMETFADQAVIAIENVRLFSELQASNSDLKVSLEQQTATSELLKVIGGSTFDLQPVFETLAENAYRLCEAQQAAVFRLDGSVLRVVATYNASPELRAFFERTPIAPGRGSVSGRAALEGRTVHILDVRDDPEFTWGQLLEVSTTLRSVLAVPMIRGGEVLGVIAVNRHEVRPFTESQVALLETFADQAAIAIENARLLNELQERTTQLTHSVGELQALGEVSQAVGSTLDLEAVLATIVSRAVELSGSDQGIVYEFDEAAQVFHQRATHQVTAEYLEAVRTAPIRLGEGVIGRVGVTREPLQITDIEADLQLVAPQVRRFLTQDGMRSLLAVPLIREDRLLGGIVILRRQRGAFSPDVIATLQSFATQSVLAIHNARLFREIQRQKQYADALVETSPVAIVTMDLEGVVMGWNPGAERLFGYTQDEAMGRELAVLVTTPEAREEVRGAIRQTLTGERYRSITRRWRKDGTIVDVETSAKFVVVEGVQVGLIAIYHDITELLQARREAETANEAKSAFLATMSHEIRTPMNAVIGMSGLLLNTALTDEQREYAEIVRQSGDALLTVINDILDFSKIEAGKLEMESQPFDLRECVEGALDLVATRAAEKGLDLAYLLGDATPAGIVGDVTRLRQVLLNLLSNAVKFTESGEVVLSVSSQPIAGTEAHELTFSVRDTGIGIAPERLDRLFQSFSQVDASTTRRYGGTGLGLAISQRLTELMGGRISVASEVGVGSEFRFTIKAAPALVPVPTRRDLSGVQPSLRGKRVLVVDDNATNRRILTTHLGAWGMHARATESPIEALEWVRGGEGFDIGILDMHMPEMDGVALSRAIREHRAHDAFPLVLFTSLGRRESRADSEGFAAYLHKPIKPSQLFDALVSVLAEQPIHVQARGTIRTELDPEMATRHPLRILLAEDNVVNQKVAIRLLGQMGYRADVAGNGIEAVDAIARQKYDVVLMDVQMPELDGFGASREINRRWPGTRPRIVAMTANAMQGDRELCEAAGMDDYVAKPIRVEELVAALERIRPRLDAAHSDPVATGAPAAAGSGSGDGASSIDAAIIDALAATMGGAFIAELIDTFGEDARELIATLRQGLAAGDVDVFRRAAHSLKSTSETLGARRLAAMARELETLARSGAIGGTEERVERLAAEYATAAERLKEVRRDLPA